MTSIVVAVDGLRSLGFAAISTSYAAVGTAFAHPMRLVHFVNNTDGDLLVSFDNNNDNLFIPAGGFILYDETTNRQSNGQGFYFRVNTTVYVKYSTAPTSGAFYVMCQYGAGE
jgi:hypothetical protein